MFLSVLGRYITRGNKDNSFLTRYLDKMQCSPEVHFDLLCVVAVSPCLFITGLFYSHTDLTPES